MTPDDRLDELEDALEEQLEDDRRLVAGASVRRADADRTARRTPRRCAALCATARHCVRAVHRSLRRRLLEYGSPSGSPTSVGNRVRSRRRAATRRAVDPANRFAVVYHLLSVTAQLAPAPAGVWLDDGCPDRRFGDRHLGLGELVRARGVRSVRHPVRRPSGPAPHPHRLRLHRPSRSARISR